MNKDIILIGPVGVGKSTISKLLSEKLNIPLASLDEKRWDIYKEINYDFEYANNIFEKEGFLELYKYWKPFEAYSVKRALELYPDHIHDFGAGQTVYEDEDLFTSVNNTLMPYQNIFLLLPSKNKEESLAILLNRNSFKYNYLFINNSSNQKLAKTIIYTKEKSPLAVCDEIIQKLK